MKQFKITTYNNAVTARSHNKRVTVFEREEGKFTLEFSFADEDANNPAVLHKCLKNKVRLSQINLSEEGMDLLAYSYLEYKKNKLATQHKTRLD